MKFEINTNDYVVFKPTGQVMMVRLIRCRGQYWIVPPTGGFGHWAKPKDLAPVVPPNFFRWKEDTHA